MMFTIKENISENEEREIHDIIFRSNNKVKCDEIYHSHGLDEGDWIYLKRDIQICENFILKKDASFMYGIDQDDNVYLKTNDDSNIIPHYINDPIYMQCDIQFLVENFHQNKTNED